MQIARVTAWRNAGAIWLAACAVLGFGCFVFAGDQLHAWPDRFWAAVVWQLVFGVALAALLLGTIAWERAQELSLRDVGWRKPTSRTALALGMVFGALYVSGVYAGILNDPAMQGVDPFALPGIRFALIPLGISMGIAEEALMRGYFMTELARGGAPTWAQMLLSGGCSAAYHSFHNPSWIGFLPSFLLFSLHAGLYVFARRSLTPTIVAHSMYHVLCAPYLLMFAMAQSYAT